MAARGDTAGTLPMTSQSKDAHKPGGGGVTSSALHHVNRNSEVYKLQRLLAQQLFLMYATTCHLCCVGLSYGFLCRHSYAVLQEAACERDGRQAEQSVGQLDPRILQTQQGVCRGGGEVCVRGGWGVRGAGDGG